MKKLLFGLMSIGVIGAIGIVMLVYRENRTTAQNSSQAVSLTKLETTNFIPNKDNDPAIGSPNAKIVIVAFADFQCPYSREAAPIMTNLLKRYPNDIVYVYRDFPLYPIHALAIPAAQAAQCANEQGKFWEYHNLIFNNQAELTTEGIFLDWAKQLRLNTQQFTQCVQSEKYQGEVQLDIDEAILAGLDSTPSYFVNGTKLVGVRSEAEWVDIIENVLAK